MLRAGAERPHRAHGTSARAAAGAAGGRDWRPAIAVGGFALLYLLNWCARARMRVCVCVCRVCTSVRPSWRECVCS